VQREGNTGWPILLMILLGVAAGPGLAGWGKPAAPAAARSSRAAPAAPQAPAAPAALTAEARREARIVGLLSEAFGIDGGDANPTLAAFAARAKYAGADDVGRIFTLVVSVPDPRRSLMSLYFDQSVETFVNAVQQFGMSKSNTLFPWPAPERAPDGDTSPGAEEPVGPGVMVFHAPSASRGVRTPTDWLVAFLVGESPVLGARHSDVLEAVRWASALSTEQPAPLRVLGPFFSGGARPLSVALQHSGVERVELITGSATAQAISDLFPGPRLQLRRTVPFDAELLDFLVCQIAERHRPRDVKIAVLTEIGTVYGSGFQKTSAASPANGTEAEGAGTRRCGKPEVPASADAPRSPEVPATAVLRSFGFPLHISKLRATRQRDQKSADEPAATLRRTLELKIDAQEEATPDAPQTFSKLTSYESELMLRQLLQRVCADGSQYLLLAATDPADVLFLAQQARSYCPGVVLGALSADLLFIHPDLRSTFSGMLVGSPYPLLFDSAALAPTRQSAPFPSDIANGFYNASLASLNELIPSTGRPAARLLRYHTPRAERESNAHCLRDSPQLWLTMVANNAYWPLARRCAVDSISQAYRPPAQPQQRRQGEREPVVATGLGAALAGILLLIATLQLLHSLHRERTRAPASGLAMQRYALAQHLTLPCLMGLILPIAPFVIDEAEWWRGPLLGYAAGVALGLLILAARLAVRCQSAALVILCQPALGWGRKRWKLPAADLVPREPSSQAWATLFSGLIMLWMICTCIRCAWEWHELAGTAQRMLLARSVDPLGMSPLVPLCYLAGGYYLWATSGLRRIAAERQFSPLSPFPIASAEEPEKWAAGAALQDLTRRLQGIWLGTQISPEVCTLVVLALPALYFWHRLLPTFEGHAYDCLLRAGFLVLYGSVAFACVKFTLSWQLLVRFLRQLAAQPMSDAYDRVAVKVAGSFGLQFNARRPDAREFALSAYNCRLLATLASEIPSSVPYARPFDGAVLQQWAEQVESAVHRCTLPPPPPSTNPHARANVAPPASDQLQAQIHTALFTASAGIFEVLQRLWAKRAAEPRRDEVREKTDLEGLLPGERNARIPTAVRFMRAVPPDIYLWTRMAEDFVAMRVVSFVQQMLFQLRNLLIFALTGALGLVLVVASYPLQPVRFVTVFAWFLMLLVIGMSLLSILAMERDEILSRLGNSRPGGLSFNVNFIGQLVIYVLLPAAAVIASVFPEISELLFSWLDPLTRLLP